MTNPLIERIKKHLDVESDEELAEKLDVAKRQIKRWHVNSFHPSTELLITLLLEKIDNLLEEIC